MVVVFAVAICSQSILLIVMRIAWDPRNGPDSFEMLRARDRTGLLIK
jgi:hypothetical protein